MHVESLAANQQLILEQIYQNVEALMIKLLDLYLEHRDVFEE